MLTFSEIRKPLKFFLAFSLCKAVLFGSLCILLASNGKISYQVAVDNASSQNSAYINSKYASNSTQIHVVTLIMSGLGVTFSLINLISFLVFYTKANKKQPKFSSHKKPQYSSIRLRSNFIIIFLQSVSLLNMLSRFVQQIREFTVYNIASKTIPIVGAVLIGLAIICHFGCFWILGRLLVSLNDKVRTLQEYSFYSDRTSVRENLMYNKIGYVKQLMKSQNYSSRSTSLKTQTIRGLHSGYKYNNFSLTREVIYKLIGGNKEQFFRSDGQNSTQRKISEENEFNHENQSTNQKNNHNKKGPNIGPVKTIELNLLDIKPKMYQPGPNQQNLEYTQNTNRVLNMAYGKKAYDQSQSEQNQQQKIDSQKQIQNGKPQQMTMKKYLQEKFRKIEEMRKKQEVTKKIKEEEELKQNFNLTPNIQERQKHINQRNWQNIDQNGHYYIVNVQKIKKKSKLLSIENLSKNKGQIQQINENPFNDGIDLFKKKERVAKNHQKVVQQYLKTRSFLVKQEMLLYESQSEEYSDSFDEKDLSSQYTDQSQEENQENESDHNQQAVVQGIKDQNKQENKGKDKQKNIEENKGDKVENQKDNNFENQNTLKQKNTKVKRKKRQPELYLHMRRKKNPDYENKIKLYDDDDPFYDDAEDFESSQQDQQFGDPLGKQIDNLQNKKGRRNSALKQKQDEEQNFKNKQLETKQAQRLRFIRRKYIEPEFRRITEHKPNDNSAVVFSSAQHQELKSKR